MGKDRPKTDEGTAEVHAGGFYHEFALWTILAGVGLFATRRQLTNLRPARLLATAIASARTVGSLVFMLRSSDLARPQSTGANLWPMFSVYVVSMAVIALLTIRVLQPSTWKQQHEKIDGIPRAIPNWTLNPYMADEDLSTGPRAGT